MEISHDAGIGVSPLIHAQNNVGGVNSYFPKNQMPLMAYKTFTWRNNPSKCNWSCDRTVIRHKYPQLNVSDIEDFDPDGAIITGEGEFFGPYAYNEWRELVAIFNDHGPGEFFHPVYTDVKQAILKKLEAKLEPRDNYVSYSFEFWQYSEPEITIIDLSDIASSTNTSTVQPSATQVSHTYGILKIGSTGPYVKELQEKLMADGIELPYGADSKYGSYTEAAVRVYQSKHGLQVDGDAGPDTLSSIGVAYYTDDNGSPASSSTSTYVVKSGDTLWGIAKSLLGDGSRYTEIARASNIKNPNIISVGQVLTIP